MFSHYMLQMLFSLCHSKANLGTISPLCNVSHMEERSVALLQSCFIHLEGYAKVQEKEEGFQNSKTGYR